MADRITKEQAAALLADATPGPWVVRGSVSYDGPTTSVRSGYAESSYPITGTLPSDRNVPDAALIAAAPDLAATVIALHDEAAELRATLAAMTEQVVALTCERDNARGAWLAARKKRERYEEALSRIEGGDVPSDDAAWLRRVAYEALMGIEVSRG